MTRYGHGATELASCRAEGQARAGSSPGMGFGSSLSATRCGQRYRRSWTPGSPLSAAGLDPCAAKVCRMAEPKEVSEQWFAQMVQKRAAKSGLRPRVAAGIIAFFWIVAIVGFGLLIHVTDKTAYDSWGDGMWWATQTVTTVGYGDIVPDTTVGRLVASALMIGGLSFFAVITGIITSGFVARAQAARGGPYATLIAELQAEIGGLKGDIAALSAKFDERR